ncbi:hypothetical protein RNAN_0378 [Rheinheimera nanhaiensis E407-8]|uniref:Uncharacterized protein n=1 Tax=Rheinheimera nanhaiensis E407-8 TaxID=562729 RepID=I1DTN2_9GAMM|nr:hypothetical protein RNAN_0378 [Rheinheimera nanhaiensis E407-8]
MIITLPLYFKPAKSYLVTSWRQKTLANISQPHHNAAVILQQS